jgi:hypothetical protein
MSLAPNRAKVTLRPRRLWSLRASLAATRWVLYAVAAVGVAATVRNTLDPPVSRVVRVVTRPVSDVSSAWFALSFARAYLTWSSDPTTPQPGVTSFMAPDGEQDAGLEIGPNSAERVIWTAVAAEQNGADGDRAYTIAAATGAGVRYLVVVVGRGAQGLPVLAQYPTLVGPPGFDEASSLDGGALPAVTDPAAKAVVDRALSNYLTGSSENLAADLAEGAQVAPVAGGLTPRGIQRLVLEPSGSVLATLRAADAQGDVFTLTYELSLVEIHGRWEIARIEP